MHAFAPNSAPSPASRTGAWNRLFVLVPFVLAAVAAGACGSSTETTPTPTADGGATDGGAEPNDCVPYTPASISGTKEGTFATRDDIVKVKLPETDVGGGLLKVTYEAKVQPLVGSIWLGEGAPTDAPRAETSAFGPGVTNADPAVVYFRLAGKKSYEVGVKPFFFADDPAKDGYKMTYTYEPQNDCYEGNDTSATAKRIPVNTTITASLHTGIGPTDTGLVKESGEDWYAFTLAAPKTVQLKAFLPGKDGPAGKNSTLMTVFQADGVTAAGCASGEGLLTTNPVADTENVETCSGSLAAGRYLVKLEHFVSQASSTAVNTAPHKSWNTPYTFSIVAN